MRYRLAFTAFVAAAVGFALPVFAANSSAQLPDGCRWQPFSPGSVLNVIACQDKNGMWRTDITPNIAAPRLPPAASKMPTSQTPQAESSTATLISAAEAGSTEAMFFLGVFYSGMNGGDKDYVQAMRWYRMAADKGHPEALTSVGIMYSQGWGVAKDEAEAVRWYRRAVEKGDGAGMHNLAKNYEEGLGVEKDLVQAAQLRARIKNDRVEFVSPPP